MASVVLLAFNRFAVIFEYDKLYKIFFGRKWRIFVTMAMFDLFFEGILFFTFYFREQLQYSLVVNIYIAELEIPYWLSIGLPIIPNVTSLVMMSCVVCHIAASTKQLTLGQEKFLKERKRITLVCIVQIFTNLLVWLNQLYLFHNSGTFRVQDRAFLPCYHVILHFLAAFNNAINETLVLIDSLIYLFFLTPYRQCFFAYLNRMRLFLRKGFKKTLPIVSSLPATNNFMA